MTESDHRFAVYNIRSGGFPAYEYQSTHPEGLPLLQEVIGSIDADVVGFVDTFRWDELYSPQDLQELFGYPYAHVINLKDERLKTLEHNNGVGILSRLPVVDSHVIWMESRNALLTTLRVGTRDVDVGVVYLDDKEESVRLDQVRSLIGQLDPRRATILMGDFNTIGGDELLHAKREVKQLPDSTSGLFWPKLARMNEGQVLAYLTAQGFADGATKKEATAPTLLIRPRAVAALFRIDYAFARGRIRVANLHVVKSAAIEKASDHYPLVFDVHVP
jgi:endonuclease/exonuclease/phosphatase family metal-dependent hydrolase